MEAHDVTNNMTLSEVAWQQAGDVPAERFVPVPLSLSRAVPCSCSSWNPRVGIGHAGPSCCVDDGHRGRNACVGLGMLRHGNRGL